jgi:hypothetical protein
MLWQEMDNRGFDADSGVATPKPPNKPECVVSIWFHIEQEATTLCTELAARGIDVYWNAVDQNEDEDASDDGPS